MQKHYKVIVIGSGQGGNPLAKRLAEAGWKTCLIEQRWVGGTCVNDGCTATKTMIASAQAADLTAHAKALGVDIDGYSVNLPAIVERKNKIVFQSRDGLEQKLQATDHLDLVYGTATFTGRKTVSVTLRDGTTAAYAADFIFINTGVRPAIPRIEGLDTVGYLTSTTILDLKVLPEHLLVVGSGYIGLELGQMFRRFGSRVTLIDPHSRLLPREDADIADTLKTILENEGITLYSSSKLRRVQPDGDGVIATIDKHGTEVTVKASHLLMATGRTPNTDALNLAAAGVETDDKGYIKTDEALETTAPGVYALGDVKGGPAFTHISYNDYLILFNNVRHGHRDRVTGRLVPYCIFTDPPLGRVGLTEQEAREKGLNVEIATLPMSRVARANEVGRAAGLMKAVVDRETKQILGAAVLGNEGGEIVTILQVAMMGGLTYEALRDGIFAHPTYAESLNNLFAGIGR
ncbi:mercuric reductase [Dawidia soli]|uniref:Mercuric reductase n=1 Tax=Dawidia soli TaxID=2782352 RepID=A0AAP2DB72_9BACT|nr:mercuric reductase [Dawidia soli]MBT1688801.1 mercuric reductase [Dawidia soli]